VTESGARVVTQIPESGERAISGHAGREEAGRAIWNWRAPRPAPATAGLRRRMGLQAGAGILVGTAFLGLRFHRAGTLALTLSTVLLVLSALAPIAILTGIRRGLEVFADLVGRIVSAVVLTIVYFGFFLPAGLLGRRNAKARAHARYKRSFDRAASTYWATRTRPPSSPERQF
jgi:hypothetical protein